VSRTAFDLTRSAREAAMRQVRYQVALKRLIEPALAATLGSPVSSLAIPGDGLNPLAPPAG
jgi:hypothetical protein